MGFVSKEKVRLLVDVKVKIEQATPGLYAVLLIASPKEPNAFASMQNGRPVVGITLGMLDLVGWDRDAYAAIIGHEYAHLALHHGAARAQREGVSRAASEVLGLILSSAGVPMGGTLANLGVTAIERVYTRDEESDADKAGFEYLTKAGFDPEGAIRLWESMNRTATGFAVPFLATHPMTQERITTMKALVHTHTRRAESASAQAAATPRSDAAAQLASPASLPAREELALIPDAQRRIAVGRRVRISMEPIGMYKEPSRDSERVERIYKADQLLVEEISGDWLKVRSSTGSRGWIMRSWIGNTP